MVLMGEEIDYGDRTDESHEGVPVYVTYCHIKRESAPDRSNAYDKTLCGREDSGQYYYVTLERDEQIEEKVYPICPRCAEVHINEHYASLNQS